MKGLYKNRIDSLLSNSKFGEDELLHLEDQILKGIKDNIILQNVLEYLNSCLSRFELIKDASNSNVFYVLIDEVNNAPNSRNLRKIVSTPKKIKKTLELVDKSYNKSTKEGAIASNFIGYTVADLAISLEWKATIIQRYLKSIYKVDFDAEFVLNQSKVKALSGLVFSRLKALERIDLQNKERPTFKKSKRSSSALPGVYGRVQKYGPGKIIYIKSR
jgi:hypothetical protein